MFEEEKTKTMLKTWILLALTSATVSFASLEVSFLEVRNSKGEVIQLEPDFPYAHVVISFEGRVLHSHPRTGVVWADLSEVNQFGTVKETMSVESKKGMFQEIEQWIGRPYDSQFSWGNDAFYCSELVAKVLGIPPEPMHFDPHLWPPKFWEMEGEPGISPGKIYRKIAGQDFSF